MPVSPPHRSKPDPVKAAQQRVANQIGILMGFWGFKRVHGRVWTVLFLAQRELCAREIREQLGISVGATSMALSELRQWGAVREVSGPRRCSYYEPETNVWRLVSHVLDHRERRLLDNTLEVLEQASTVLRENRAGCVAAVEKLIWLTRLAQGMLAMLTSRGRLEADDTSRMKV